MHYLIHEYNTNSSKLFTKPFFIIPARNQQNVKEKIIELENMQVPYIIICGERVNHPNVVYREARGKWDAINFGSRFIPEDAEVVVLNDVDTRIHNFEHALSHLNGEVDVVYCKVNVHGGPQVKFYKIADPIRKRFHIFASGELMLVRRDAFKRVLPIPPCIAEDSYILFKALELGYRAHFCTKTYVTTGRTTNAEEEGAYKARTTLGIYQALKYTKPPPWIRTFYKFLPTAALLLALAGEDGRAWMKGIREAVKSNVMKRYPTKF
jgi:cellulose synthase/poly-beta-1,6-N-acetylglucosamine synthase-like glycosyltransferase